MGDTWQCGECETFNADSKTACRACGTARPARTAPAAPARAGRRAAPGAGGAPWACAGCETVNAATAVACTACKQRRPEPTARPPSARPKRSRKPAGPTGAPVRPARGTGPAAPRRTPRPPRTGEPKPPTPDLGLTGLGDLSRFFSRAGTAGQRAPGSARSTDRSAAFGTFLPAGRRLRGPWFHRGHGPAAPGHRWAYAPAPIPRVLDAPVAAPSAGRGKRQDRHRVCAAGTGRRRLPRAQRLAAGLPSADRIQRDTRGRPADGTALPGQGRRHHPRRREQHRNGRL